MKTLIWSVFALFILLWTGLAMVSVALSEWLLGFLQAGANLTAPLSNAAIPAWLQVWIDPVWLTAFAEMLKPTLETLGQLMPSTQTLGTLVAVMVWGVWGLGALFLLAAAVGAHWFVGRR